MLKNAGAAFLGYIVIVAFIMASLGLLWVVLGPEGAFQPGSWEASAVWAWTAVGIGFVVAAIGGWVTARVGTDRTAIFILLGVMVAMTIASAIGADGAGGPRPADVGLAEAMSNALSPSWFYWVNSALGIFGVLIGARLAKQS